MKTRHSGVSHGNTTLSYYRTKKYTIQKQARIQNTQQKTDKLAIIKNNFEKATKRQPQVVEDSQRDHSYSLYKSSIATSTPQLKDLYNYIIPHYAARWRVIGTLLGLPEGRLEIIEHDHYHKAEPCCGAVLQEWLEVDPYASWEKLLKVIELPAVSSDQAPDEGD